MGKTDKVDLNLNYYPGIILPSISLSLGTQYRKGGSDGQNWLDFLALCDSNNDEVIDSDDEFTEILEKSAQGTFEVEVQ